jgi:hypothetical protein
MMAGVSPLLLVEARRDDVNSAYTRAVAGSNPAATYVMSRDIVHRCLAASFTVGLGLVVPGGVGGNEAWRGSGLRARRWCRRDVTIGTWQEMCWVVSWRPAVPTR